MKYEGVKIPETISIVRHRNGHQGYVVMPGQDTGAAKNWARDYRCDFEPEIRTFTNGQFELYIYDSAGYSSQGGKLSFWNCEITTQDNQKYLIGINSDILCNLIHNTTVVNGHVQEPVYLGKIKNNVGAFTESMPEFKKAELEQEAFSQKQTSAYDVGTVVSTKLVDQIYLGTMYKYVHVNDYCYHILSEPKKVHIFLELFRGEPSHIEIFDKKPKRFIFEEKQSNTKIPTLEEALNETLFKERDYGDPDYSQNTVKLNKIALQYTPNGSVDFDEVKDLVKKIDYFQRYSVEHQ